MDANIILSTLIDNVATLAAQRLPAPAVTAYSLDCATLAESPDFRDAVRNVLDDSVNSAATAAVEQTMRDYDPTESRGFERAIERAVESALEDTDFEEIIRDNVDIPSMVESALEDHEFAELDHDHEMLSPAQVNEVQGIANRAIDARMQNSAISSAAALAALLHDPTVIGALLDVLTNRLTLTVRG